MSFDLNPLLTLATIVSIVVAAWAAIAKQRTEAQKQEIEARTSEATITELITQSAGDMITAANDQAKIAQDERLKAVRLANEKQAEVLQLEDDKAILIQEIEWYRHGTKTLGEQLDEHGIEKKWDPLSTKPMFTTRQKMAALKRVLDDNGLPSN